LFERLGAAVEVEVLEGAAVFEPVEVLEVVVVVVEVVAAVLVLGGRMTVWVIIPLLVLNVRVYIPFTGSTS
jgi:uncharacterized membrane protein YphA (DoxX/SURF4 family)